jgi:hypothetical protein
MNLIIYMKKYQVTILIILITIQLHLKKNNTVVWVYFGIDLFLQLMEYY